MKKMLLLAAAAMMALGISAEEAQKTTQQTTTTQTEIKVPQEKQGQLDVFKFHRADSKKTSQQAKKLPSDIRVVKDQKKAPKK